jgi:hypothetical protein
MSLRNQPYLPLYVQDFMTDEKLAECSASATGVYIRLMCLMHKSEYYGKILLQQNDEFCYNKIVTKFAQKLSRLMPYDVSEIENSLSELLGKNVVKIEKKKGKNEEFFLLQKRMVRDDELSKKRSKAGKKGMSSRYKSDNKDDEFCYNKNDNKIITNSITNSITNTEYENEYEYDNKFKEEKEKGVIGEKGKEEFSLENDESNTGDLSEYFHRECIELPLDEEKFTTGQKNDHIELVIPVDELSFENFWDLYDKKVGDKVKLRKKWEKLSKADKTLIIEYIPKYKEAQTDKQYRKNPETFLNQKAWNDEIITNNGNKITKNTGTMEFSNTGNGQNSFRTDAEKRRNEREMLRQVSRAILQQPETPIVQ